MKSIFNHLKRLDWVLVTAVLFLTGIGLISIYSSSLGLDDFLNFKKQVVFISAGLILMFLFSFFDYRILKNDSYLILFFYFVCLFSLVGLFFWAPEIRGVKSWYKLSIISIDPVEFTKLILVILLAKYFSMRHTEMYRMRHIILSGIYVSLPAILIFFQPNLGSVLILISLWIAILIISGIKTKHFFILCLAGLLILVLSWLFLLKDYQKERVLSFIAPQLEPLGAGWSRTQSKIAIGSGGISGQGLERGAQTQYGFLSEPQTDFIFAAIAEELGLMGVSALLGLFIIFTWRVVRIGIASQSNFSRLFTAGLAVILSSQVVVNIGMNLGLLPIIGISLPFVSYGGSNLITISIGLGILQNIKVNQ